MACEIDWEFVTGEECRASVASSSWDMADCPIPRSPEKPALSDTETDPGSLSEDLHNQTPSNTSSPTPSRSASPSPPSQPPSPPSPPVCDPLTEKPLELLTPQINEPQPTLHEASPSKLSMCGTRGVRLPSPADPPLQLQKRSCKGKAVSRGPHTNTLNHRGMHSPANQTKEHQHPVQEIRAKTALEHLDSAVIRAVKTLPPEQRLPAPEACWTHEHDHHQYEQQPSSTASVVARRLRNLQELALLTHTVSPPDIPATQPRKPYRRPYPRAPRVSKNFSPEPRMIVAKELARHS